MTTDRGVFVVLEGGDGAGKSTQCSRLVGWLRERGYPVRETREPGDTALGRVIRQALLDAAVRTEPRAEALLYAADRAQHVAEVVRPALQRGEVVVCDRYVDSSLAYQGAGRSLGTEQVAAVNRWATGDLLADLTVLLDLDPAVGLARLGGDRDRIEQESADFHDRVGDCFRELARAAPQRYLVVDAALPVADIAGAIRERVADLLPPGSRPGRPASVGRR
jgi:dTMP kinase